MTSSQIAEKLQSSFPEEKLAAGEWQLALEPYLISKEEYNFFQKLGKILARFLHAQSNLYLRSLNGKAPPEVKDLLEAGKPTWLVKAGRNVAKRGFMPRIIRPDVLPCEDGFKISELDSVPGGIGMLAFLNESYAKILPQSKIIGGEQEMVSGFASIFADVKSKNVRILVSQESADYRGEMLYLSKKLNDLSHNNSSQYAKIWSVEDAETYKIEDKDALYRFFELFDYSSVALIEELAKSVFVKGGDELSITPTFAHYLEEKLQLALFHNHNLREIWRRELRANNFEILQKLIPKSIVVDPIKLPFNAILPLINCSSWQQAQELSKSARDFILKVSGFSALSWGARGVAVGSDLSQSRWAECIDEALLNFPRSPSILQKFHKAKLVEIKFWNKEKNIANIMRGRARLCPYYFLQNEKSEPLLCGILATVCPADKKIIHGMKDAVLAPCAIS